MIFANEMDTLSQELHAYLTTQTGELITISDDELQAADARVDIESYCDWEKAAIQTAQEILRWDDPLSIPSKFEIDEYSITKRFCNEIKDAELSNELLFQIKGLGAFRHFKHTVDRYNVTNDWYRYRQTALKKIAIDWLESNSISYEITKRRTIMKFEGTWHITSMEKWDEDYFNMASQAYIKIDQWGSGEFQFGLVSGEIAGEIAKEEAGGKLDFTWDGCDENDAASGNGWLKFKDKNILVGRINFHQGDSCLFSAKRA